MQILAGACPACQKQKSGTDVVREIEKLVFQHRDLLREKYHEHHNR